MAQSARPRWAPAAAEIRPEEARMLFVWTPQRVRIAVYFVAAYLALC